MKKTIFHIGMLAAAALAFFSCAKETESSYNGRTHTIVVTVDKVSDSKTAIVEGDNEASYKWTSGDEQYFHIYENGTEAQSVSMSLSNGDKTATFTAYFSESQASEFVYTAKFAKASSNAGNPTIHTEQSPATGSFDPSADILIASPITRSTQPATLQFSLRRVVSVNKMTLKGLVAGEVISSVEIGSDKSLGGYYLIESEGYNVTGKKLTLTYNATVPASGEFPVYFICGPADANKLHIHVVTDKNVYDRNDFNSTIDFQVGVVQRFNVNLANYGTPVSTGTSYVLVENQADLVDGATYIIVGESSKSSTLYALGQQNTNNRSGVAVVDNSGVITVDNTLEVYPIIIEEDSGNYTLKDSDSGKYLYTNQTGSNRLFSEDTVDDYAKWTISITNGVASINNVGNTSRGMLCFNPNWQNNSDSNPIFAGYGSVPTNGTSDLALYIDQASLVPDPRDEAGMSWSSSDVNATIEDGDVINFTAPTLNNPNSVSPITFSSTDTDVAEINISGAITIKAGGTTTIQAIFAGNDDYKPQTVEYTLVVADNRTPVVSYAFETVAQLNALASDTEVEKFGKLTDAVVSFVPNAKNAVIKDATGSVLFYKDGHGLLQGQTFSGDVTVKVKLYNGCSEITACDASFTGSGAVVAPATPTLSQLVGHLSDWQNAYVQVSGLEVTAVDGKNVTVTDNTNSYVVYSSAANATCVVGDVITVTGTVSHHSDKDQITAWSTDAIVVTSHPVASHTITISQPEGAAATAGCSIAASANDSSVASGASLQEGTVVTITATEGTDYSFVSWTVTGATVSDASANPTTFTVGTADVTISATFADDNAGTPGSETFDLTKKTYTTGSDYVTWSGSSVSITNSSASGGTVATNYLGGDSNNRTSSRFYSSNTLTIAPKSGYTITSVVFSATSANYATAFSGSNWTNATSSVSGSTVTVIPTNGANNITAVIGGTCGFTGITVYYLYSGSGSQTPVTYAVTWSNPTGGTIAATVGGNAISSGDEFEEGTVVSISATAASGYTFSSWSLTGATAANASNASTTFTVGTSDVNVNASFTQNQQPGGTTDVTFTPGTDTGSTSVTKSGVTVTMTTMNNASYYQVYANQSMTVSSEKDIVKIEFTCTANGTAKYGPGNASANVGSYSYSGNKGTWTGSAKSVTISSTAQIRMTSLVITYNN